MFQRTWLLGTTMLALGTSARAQSSFPEFEPNDNKAAANAIVCMTAGDSLTGTTTGTSTTVAGAASSDNFRITVCAEAPGIYQRRLVITTPGPAGHTGTLRGFTQTAGVVATTSDTAFATTNLTSTPIRMNQWYGFGQAEQFYYRVTGTTSTTDVYTSTLSSTPVSPIVVAGSFVPGPITLSSVGSTTVDTEIYLYDSNFDQVPNGHNDNEATPSVASQSFMTRTLAAGTYYAIISRYELSDGTADLNADERFLLAPVMDSTDLMCSSVTVAALDLDFTISDGVTTAPLSILSTSQFEVFFVQFTVGTPAAFNAFCAGDGTLTDHTTPCPCGNNGAIGNGCGHSFDANGANLSATGTPSLDDVVLHSQFEPVSSFTLMMQHGNGGDVTFHDGVLCASNPLIRLRGRAAVGGEAFFPNSLFANDSTTTLSARGGTFPGSGQTMRYAAWYRNASTTFCPPATANVTNGWVIDW